MNVQNNSQEKVQALEVALEAANKLADVCKSNLLECQTAWKRDVVNLTTVNNSLREQVQDLTNKLDAAECAIHSSEEELEQCHVMRTNNEVAVKTSQGIVKAATDAVSDYEKRIAELKAIIRTWEDDYTALKGKYKALKKAYKRIKRTPKVQAMRSELYLLRRIKAQLEAEVSEATNDEFIAGIELALQYLSGDVFDLEET